MNTNYLNSKKVYLQDIQVLDYAFGFQNWDVNFADFLAKRYGKIADRFGGGAGFCEYYEDFFHNIRNFKISSDVEKLNKIDVFFIDCQVAKQEGFNATQIATIIQNKMPKIFVVESDGIINVDALKKTGYKIFENSFDNKNYFVGFLDESVDFEFYFDDIKFKEDFVDGIFKNISDIIYDNTTPYFKKLAEEIEE